MRHGRYKVSKLSKASERQGIRELTWRGILIRSSLSSVPRRTLGRCDTVRNEYIAPSWIFASKSTES